MRGIMFAGKHSYRDLGVTIAPGRNIGNPTKIKIKERVPYSNEIYDFSGIYGGQEYEERTLNYTFNVVGNYKKEHFSFMKVELLNWLMGPNEKTKLVDDAIPGYYFLAEVEEGPSIEENSIDGTVSVEFIAYPFKISELEEGNDIWDSFNFFLDYSQVTEFDVSGTKEITLYNNGVSVIKPVIRSSSPMQLKLGDMTYNVPAGESQSHDFILADLKNKITINGTGTISFNFRKELI